jgi:hypothetical protein
MNVTVTGCWCFLNTAAVTLEFSGSALLDPVTETVTVHWSPVAQEAFKILFYCLESVDAIIVLHIKPKDSHVCFNMRAAAYRRLDNMNDTSVLCCVHAEVVHERGLGIVVLAVDFPSEDVAKISTL